MFKAEYSPLINKSDRTNTKSTNGKCMSIRYVSILVLCVIGAYLIYDVFLSSSPSSLYNLFISNQTPKWYPTSEEIDEYRLKTVLIEYDMEDLPASADIGELGSAKMNKFHDNLLIKHGYNSVDHNVHFFVMDDDSLEADVGDALRCGTMYTMSYDAGFMELNCGDKFKSPKMMVTGCVSFERDTNGQRYGETGHLTSDCMTSAVDTGLTVLAGRCCAVRGAATLTTSYATATVENAFCLEEECPEGGTAMGCGAADSQTLTPSLSGCKRTQDDLSGATGCRAQRSDPGYLLVAPFCGILDDGALRCRTQYGSKGEISTSFPGKFISRAVCPARFKLTDCNTEIKREINNCDALSAVEDYGINYGGYIEKRNCVAIGSTDHIIAIGVCCMVE